MPNVNDINRKYHIYGDIEKKRLRIDIIYRLIHYYQNYFFVRRYLTANYCLGS